MLTENQPKWTYVFIAVSLFLFLVQQFIPIWLYLAFTPALFAYYPWTLVTSIFLHIDFSHLFLNMIALLIFGTTLEKRISSRLFAVIFFTAGIVGNLGYYYTVDNTLIPVLGASGAIYGVMGTLTVLEPFMLIYIYGMVPLPLIATAAMWALADLTGLFVPSDIAHSVHLIGLFVGVIVGLYLRFSVKSEWV